MEAGEELALGPYNLATREPTTFLLVVGLLGVLLLISAGLVFLGNRTIVRTAVNYAGYSSRRTLAAEKIRAPGNPDPSGSDVPGRVAGRATGLVGIARGVRPLLQVSNPAAMLIYSIVVVIYIDPWMTLLVAVLVTPSLFLQYVVNYWAAANQERLGGARKRAHSAVRDLLKDVSKAPHVHPSQMVELESEYSKSRIRELGDRYAFRVMAQSYSALISDIVLAVVAVLLTAYLGLQALSGQLGWSLFLGYLVFARLLMLSLRGVLASITGFARHYPLLRRMYELLSSCTPNTSFTDRTLHLQHRGKRSLGDVNTAHIKRGTPIAVVSPVPVTRFNAYAFVDALVGRRSPHNAMVRGSTFYVPDALDGLPGGSLSELLGLQGLDKKDRVRHEFTYLEYPEWDPSESLEQCFDSERWRSLPEALRAHILLAAAARTSADLLLVESSILDRADDSFLDKWWKEVREVFVVVRYPLASVAARYGESLVMAMSSDRSVCLMSVKWCRENAEKLYAWFDTYKGQTDGGLEEDETDD